MSNKPIKPRVKTLVAPSLMEWALMLLVIVLTMVAVFLSIDPSRRLNEATNARRFSDVSVILDDLTDYNFENGELPELVVELEKEKVYEIGLCESGAYCGEIAVEDSCVDLSLFGEVPMDPNKGYPYHTSYYLIPHENGEITVGACEPDPEGATGEGPIPAINLRD
ncbi:MAG: hypothetical protein ACI9QC_000589 [Oceanicoccus sp.]|jgi:hypothetical protein